MPCLVSLAAGEPERLQGGHERQRGLGFGTGQVEVQRLAQVGLFTVEAGDPLELAGADPVSIGVLGELPVPVPVAAPQFRGRAGLLEFVAAVVTHRLEQPEPHHGARLLPNQDGLVNQPGEHIEQILRIVVPAYLLSGVELEGAGEHRKLCPDRLFGRRAQRVTPVHAPSQGLLAVRRAAAAAGE